MAHTKSNKELHMCFNPMHTQRQSQTVKRNQQTHNIRTTFDKLLGGFQVIQANSLFAKIAVKLCKTHQHSPRKHFHHTHFGLFSPQKNKKPKAIQTLKKKKEAASVGCDMYLNSLFAHSNNIFYMPFIV